MNEQKGLLTRLGETLDQYRAEQRGVVQEQMPSRHPGWLRTFLPTPGNVLFTLLVVAGLLWANSVGALPLRAPTATSTSTGTIAYQGRLADADGNPLTDTYNMIFRLYDVASGGVFLWEEQWTGSNGVQVSDGLFNVMLGSLTSIPQNVIMEHDSLFLGITVGTDDEMVPRVQLGSVPFAVQALTVPDGSVTTEKLAEDAVDGTRIAHAFGASGKPLTNFVMRSDIAEWDWSDPAHTGGWLDFDASSIVPPGTTAVLIRVHAVGTNDAEFGFRKNGLSGPPSTWDQAAAMYGYMPLTGGDHAVYQHYIVELDSNRIFEHSHDGKWSCFLWVIQGWWEPAHQ
jgi:hypothetical protein